MNDYQNDHLFDRNGEPTERAVARRTDPQTSWDAAHSHSSDKIRESQQLIIDALRLYGPQTDEEIYAYVQTDLSPSGARTRRAELVNLKLVYWTGEKRELRSGRMGRVWSLKS